jgi:hypothetical protein
MFRGRAVLAVAAALLVSGAAVLAVRARHHEPLDACAVVSPAVSGALGLHSVGHHFVPEGAHPSSGDGCSFGTVQDGNHLTVFTSTRVGELVDERWTSLAQHLDSDRYTGWVMTDAGRGLRSITLVHGHQYVQLNAYGTSTADDRTVADAVADAASF